MQMLTAKRREVEKLLTKRDKDKKIKAYIEALEDKVESLNGLLEEALDSRKSFTDDLAEERRRGDRYKRQLTKLTDKTRIFLNQLKDSTIMAANRISRSHSNSSFTESEDSDSDEISRCSVSLEREANAGDDLSVRGVATRSRANEEKIEE